MCLRRALWMARSGGDRSIVGRSIYGGQVRKVVFGILPPSAQLPDRDADIWTPLHLDATALPANEHIFRGIGVLRNGIAVERAYSELDALTRRITTDYPDVYGSGFMTDLARACFARTLQL